MINSLTNPIAQGVQAQNSRGGRGRGGDVGFDGVMASVNATTNEPRRERTRADREPVHNDRPTEQIQHNEANVNNEQNQTQSTQVEEATDTSAVYAEVLAEYAPVAEEEAVDYSQVLAEMAAVLGITLEELEEVLQKLEMPLEALADAENQALVLMTAEGMESQVELLSYPEALPVLKELANIADHHRIKDRVQKEVVVDSEIHYEGEMPILGEPAPEFVEIPIEEVVVANTQNAADNTPNQTFANVAPDVIVPVADVSQQMAADVGLQFAHNIAVDATAQNNAPVQTAPTMASMPMVTPQNIADQIVQQVRFVSGQGMAEMKIHLKPEHLGDLTMRVATINGIVTAQFIADNQRVKELIEAGFNDLRDSLEEAGITVSDIEVNVRNENDPHEFDEGESNISDKRIRDLMAAAMAEEEATAHEPTVAEVEENMIDYQV
ncbi:MAG: flagellar hook-length control protein FliK [Defluviitaleaceae bacterium]|nr:flagellar hook-length control protein FliK [Defluviitaleaceae bacterium]